MPTPPADVLLISTGIHLLESLNGFGTRQRMDVGVLGVVTATVGWPGDLPSLLTAEASGHLDRFHGYRSWTTPGFEVNSTEPLIDIGVDGEALRLPPPLRFRSLFVRAHPHAGARSRRQTCRRSRQGEHRVGSRARRTPRPLTVPSAGTGR